VKPPGPDRLVIALDRWHIVGDQPAQAGVGHRLAVGEVVDDLARRPAVRLGRNSIQLLVRDPGEGIVDGSRAGAVSIHQRVPLELIHGLVPPITGASLGDRHVLTPMMVLAASLTPGAMPTERQGG
jgi:hypothetical protein